MNSGDDRLAGAKQPGAFDVKAAAPAAVYAEEFAAVAVVAAEIGAGAKSLALRGEHQRAAFHVFVEGFKGVGDFGDQRHIKKSLAAVISTSATWPFS